MTSKFSLFALLSALAFAPAIAHADLMGDTITASGPRLSPGSAVIDSGIEFVWDFGPPYFTYDFGGDTLTIKNVYDTNVSLPSDWGVQTFSGFDSVITGFSLNSNVGFTGAILTSGLMSNSIVINFGDTYAASGAVLVFDITSTPRTTVPDAGTTLAMVGAALAGLGFVRRNSRSAILSK